MNPLEQIMGVKEAATLWGLSADRVKGMCQKGEIKAKKIGRTWVIDRNQSNPKKYNRSDDMFTVVWSKDTVIQGGFTHSVEEGSYQADNEIDAINQAKRVALNKPYHQVYIEYFRQSDHQKAYLNPNGYELSGDNWSKAIKIALDDVESETVIDEIIQNNSSSSHTGKHAMIIAKVSLGYGTVYRVGYEIDELSAGDDVYFEYYEDAREYAEHQVDLI